MGQDPQVIAFNRLLASQEKVLLSESDTNHFQCRFQRAKSRANLDYTRSLLLTLSNTKLLSEDDLRSRRERIKRLQTRLSELEQQYSQKEEEEDTSTEDESQDQPAPSKQPQETSGLRQRLQAQPPAASATASTSATANTTSNRFSSAHPASKTFSEKSALQAQEQNLASMDRESESIQADLLSLVQQLKASTQSIGTSIESEKELLNSTVLGLDKSVGGMEGAGGKMKQLKKESEAWFWTRYRLYAQIWGLLIAATLGVFLGPKLRF